MDQTCSLARQSAAETADVFITDALLAREPKRLDRKRELNAILALATKMADEPSEVLPHFVDLAMELTGAVSAGLSLYDSQDRPELFEWRYLRGSLARFEHVTTPRDHSPCGVTLDRNTATLAAYPERVYEWISDAGIVVPEVLLVPLHIGGEALGTLWVVSDEEEHFDRGDAEIATELASMVGVALRMARSEAALRQSLEEQETIAKEMSHRLKNIFTMADGMIRVSAKTAETPGAMANALSGRIGALARAHSLLRRKVQDIGSAATTDLGELVAAVLAAHESVEQGDANRFALDGPSVQCGDHAANGIALLAHELATNASKYGALSRKGGLVELSWRVDDHFLDLHWIEKGGPAIDAPPSGMGFGTTLTDRTVKSQFKGTLDRQWLAQGLSVHMRLSLDRLGQ